MEFYLITEIPFHRKFSSRHCCCSY